MIVKLLTEHHLEFLSLKGGCTGSPECTLVKMPHCLKSHIMAYCLIPLYYSCGTVCLSLLGTWQGQNGEEWNEKTSTVLQVRSLEIWTSARQNLSSGLPTKRDSNRSPQLQRLARKMKFCLLQVFVLYFPKGKTKALTSLCGCTG